jgi:antitoxin Phd
MKTSKRGKRRKRPSDYPAAITKASSVTATEAKNEFGRVLERVIQGERVYITRHESPKAVLLSVADFDALMATTQTKLDALTGEFDALLARMQSPGARAAMQVAFGASPQQLGIAAVEAARKRE